VLDGKVDPEDLHALYEVPANDASNPSKVQAISTARAAA